MTSDLPDDFESAATIRGLRPDDVIVGRFCLVRCLGRGGMGEVWLAHDRTLQENIALKLLPRLIQFDDHAVDDLKNETRQGRQLSHPHVVRVFDFYQDEKNAGIAMEFVDGDTLAKLRMSRPHSVFTAGELHEWTLGLLDGLDYAHRRSVVHRDLKPANLMVEAATGSLKIADFGIARSLMDSMARATMAAQSRGTLCYMSPEQAIGHSPHPQDDIYAIGATLFELLAGSPPFYTGDLYAQIQNVSPPTIAERQAQHGFSQPPPAAWEAAIQSCLSKKRADRPQSAAELKYLLGMGGTLPPQTSASTDAPALAAALAVTQPRPTTPRARPATSGAPWGKIGLATLLAALAAGAGHYYLKGRQPEAVRRDADISPQDSTPVITDPVPPFTAPPTGRAWRVPGDFPTLEQAISQAGNGQRITLAASTEPYKGPLRLKPGLQITGAGPDQTRIIIDRPDASALAGGDCTDISIEGLSFASTHPQSERTAEPVAQLVNCHVRFKNCHFSSSPSTGLRLTGIEGRAVFESCVFQNNGSDGCEISSGATAEMKDCTLENNGRHGLSILLAGSQLTMQGGTVNGNAASGAEVSDAGTLIARESQFLNNREAGIYTHDKGSLLTLEKIASSGNWIGVLINRSGKANLVSCTFAKNKESGLDGGEPGDIDLRSTTIELNDKFGIRLVGKTGSPASITLEGNTIRKNALGGIALMGSALSPTVSKNSLGPNGQFDLYLTEGAGGTIEHNDCQTPKSGIVIDPGCKPLLGTNTPARNKD